MPKAAIALDKWKLSIFERHLTQAGYTFEKCPGITPDSLLITVETENIVALAGVAEAANSEAAMTGARQ